MAAGNSNQSGSGWGSGNVVAPSGGEFTPNLPSGMTLYTDALLGDMNGGQQGGVGENTPNANGLRMYGEPNADPLLAGYWRNTTDVDAPYGTSVNDWDYPEGSYGRGWNNVYLGGDGIDKGWVRTYFAMSIKFSSNYSMHTNGEKFYYPTIKFPTEAQTGPVMQLKLIGTDTHDSPYIGFYGDAQIGESNSIYTQPSANPVRIVKGVYNTVEMFTQLNTPGNADGIWRVWVDNQLAVEVTDFRFTPAARTEQGGIAGPRFTGTRGGGYSTYPVPTGGQYKRLHRLAFYGSTSF